MGCYSLCLHLPTPWPPVATAPPSFASTAMRRLVSGQEPTYTGHVVRRVLSHDPTFARVPLLLSPTARDRRAASLRRPGRRAATAEHMTVDTSKLLTSTHQSHHRKQPTVTCPWEHRTNRCP